MTDQTTGYPSWICDGCGKRYGRRTPTLCTIHMGQCDICKNLSAVTEPRDYGHLLPGWEIDGPAKGWTP